MAYTITVDDVRDVLDTGASDTNIRCLIDVVDLADECLDSTDPLKPFCGDAHFLLVMHVFADARPWLHVCVGASKRAVVRARACTRVVRECCGMQAVLCSGRGLQTFAGNIPTGSPSNFLNEIIYVCICICICN